MCDAQACVSWGHSVVGACQMDVLATANRYFIFLHALIILNVNNDDSTSAIRESVKPVDVP